MKIKDAADTVRPWADSCAAELVENAWRATRPPMAAPGDVVHAVQRLVDHVDAPPPVLAAELSAALIDLRAAHKKLMYGRETQRVDDWYALDRRIAAVLARAKAQL